jgi:hypothetical protein
MSAHQKRVVFDVVKLATRTFGWILIAIAIFSLPQMRILTGRLAFTFDLLTSAALGLVGAVWLVAVEVFLHFFDEYLSRN